MSSGRVEVVFALLFTGALVLLAIMMGITEIFGISFGIGWDFPNSGTEVRKALTPKIADIETPWIFLGEEERLAVDVDVRPEEGRVWVILSDRGWGPAGHWEPMWRVSARSSTRTDTTVTAPHAGFYGVGGMLSSARGDFRIDWRVENPRTWTSSMRLVALLASNLWIVLPLVVVAAAVVWKAFS